MRVKTKTPTEIVCPVLLMGNEYNDAIWCQRTEPSHVVHEGHRGLLHYVDALPLDWCFSLAKWRQVSGNQGVCVRLPSTETQSAPAVTW